jgi:hypothetical protein
VANTEVTFETDTKHARSESSIAIHPTNPFKMVAASKRFTDPVKYIFTLATSFSTDGGGTWTPSSTLQLHADWTILADPGLAWAQGDTVYLVGVAFGGTDGGDPKGTVVYKSTDAGKTWGPPVVVDDTTGDKPWIAADPNTGNVFAVWNDTSVGLLRFARSPDGISWNGAGNDPKFTDVVPMGTASPDIAVAPNGDIYIAWLNIALSTDVAVRKSIDGGNTLIPMPSAATGITTTFALTPLLDGQWPVLPGGTFRVITEPSLSIGPGNEVTVAWCDARQGVARIFHAGSHNGGQSWWTPASGQALVPGTIPTTLHHFHPQTAVAPDGSIGCAFYEFGPKPTTPLIDTRFSISHDKGVTWSAPATVTDKPWDPKIDAPNADALADVTFIGEYFGLAASVLGYFPLWTDTRTGVQNLFTQALPLAPHIGQGARFGQIVAQIMAGVIGDGGGVIRIGGHIIHIGPEGPGGPLRDVAVGIAMLQLAGTLHDRREAGALANAAIASVSRMLAEADRR